MFNGLILLWDTEGRYEKGLIIFSWGLEVEFVFMHVQVQERG